MAAPVVTGTVALMLQANPNLTPNLIKAILQYTAQAYPGYSPLRQGAGFLNTLGAVRLAKFYANPQAGDRMPVQTVWSRTDHLGQPPPDGRRHQADRQRLGEQRRLGRGEDRSRPTATTSSGARRPTATTSSGAPHRPTATTSSGAPTADGDNIVWGTAGDGDNIVWGTDCGGADCDNIVWGTVGRRQHRLGHRRRRRQHRVGHRVRRRQHRLGHVSRRRRDLGQRRRRRRRVVPGRRQPSRCRASTSSSATLVPLDAGRRRAVIEPRVTVSIGGI